MKKKLTNRLLSLVLALVLVLGLLPGMALKTDAANDKYTATHTQESSGHTYTVTLTRLDRNNNGEIFYYYGNVRSVYINQATLIDNFIRVELGIKFNYMANDRIIYTYFDVTPGACDKEINLTLAESCYGGDGKSPSVPSSTFTATFQVKRSAYSHQGEATCINAAECTVCGAIYTKLHNPAATWTTENGKHYHICNNGCGIKLDEGTCSYSPATCLEASVCSVCGYIYEEQKPHNYSYSAYYDRIEETCTNGCGHSATATFALTGSEFTYTGTAFEPGMVTYSDGWVGERPTQVSYENNLNVGTATAKITVAGHELTQTFAIKAVDISGLSVSVDTQDSVYNGTVQSEPKITVTFNGTPLARDRDYTVSWDNPDFMNAGIYTATVTCIGNFQGEVTRQWSIEKAALTVTAEDQTILYGEEISGAAVSVEGLAEGHELAVTLTPSTENVTANGTITAGDAVVTVVVKVDTAEGEDASFVVVDVTDNYEISYVPGVLKIEPDTSKIDELATGNVTSADKKEIQAVQEIMASAETEGLDEETEARWAELNEKCEKLLNKITAVLAEIDQLKKDVAVFDADTVKSTDKAALEALAGDIEELLDSANLTQTERSDMEVLLEQVEGMIAAIEQVAESSEAAIGAVEAVDPATVTEEDQNELEQAVADLDALLQTDHLTEEERTALDAAKADAQSLLDAIEAAKQAAEAEKAEQPEDVPTENTEPEDLETPTVTEPVQESPEEKGEGPNIWLYVILLLVLIIVIVLILVLKKRKKKE